MQRSEHVAIIDDDASMRVALARLLYAHGIDARCYSSARAFLAALPSARPYCLIVDVNMPEMTGLDLQRELLRLGVHLPTIVVTALDDERIATTAKALGAVAFLSKPLKQDSLLNAIKIAAKKPN
jgi:FixJ family two-component response regulator